MIGERQERERGRAFHVAGQAIPARGPFAGHGWAAVRGVASQAARGVEAGIVNQIVVRSVTCDAGKRAAYAVALARHQAKRLEADGNGIRWLGGRGAVTFGAEADGFGGA